MRIVNYTFGQPRKRFIVALRNAINTYQNKYPILSNTHVGAIKQSPQSKQFDKEIVVTTTGFSNLENNAVREYGFDLFLYTNNFNDMEDLTEAVDAIVTTIRESGIHWAEVESMLDDETDNTPVRVLGVNALIGATNM